MNVLITGGYGFIGLHTAERLIKEGHRVFILDNRDTNASMASFKHKYNNMDVIDEKCVEIFKINSFDVVIHLAAQTDTDNSFENPYGDNLTNVCGLVNMLSLSYKYGVGRFIFISSASVYGDGDGLPFTENSPTKPISPHAAGKLAGEEYCRVFHELYGLSTVSLRLSNAYGYKPWSNGRIDVTGELIKCALSGFDLRISGNGTQTRDFIYVEDVADAIYRCMESDFCGVMNLSSNVETRINDLVKVVRKNIKVENIIYYQSGKYDVARSWLDNTRAKRELDWVPMYSLEEGVKRTFLKYAKEYKAGKVDETKEKDGRKSKGKASGLLKSSLPYMENLFMFLVVLLIDYFQLSMGDMNFIDLKLVYIILIGVVYGTKHSIIAVGLSTILYIFGGSNAGRDLISLFYDPNSLMHIAFYLFIGFFVGYSVDIKNRTVSDHIYKYNAIQSKMDFLSSVYNETRQIKEELQKQIRMSEDSLTKVYSIIKELDAVNPEKIYSSAVNVIERIMKSRSVAIYVMGANGYFARLAACSGSIANKMKKSVRIDQYPELKAALEIGVIFINSKLVPDLPAMAMPVENNGKVIALLEIYDMEFEYVNLYFQNLFKIVSNFISSSLTNAARYQEAVFKDKYIEGTRILKREKFDEILQIRVQASEHHLSDFIVIKLPNEGNYQELDSRLANTVRETDYIGEGEDGMLHILLSNTNKNEAEHVLKRLSDANITAILETGDDISG